jgi:hypothetical protein
VSVIGHSETIPFTFAFLQSVVFKSVGIEGSVVLKSVGIEGSVVFRQSNEFEITKSLNSTLNSDSQPGVSLGLIVGIAVGVVLILVVCIAIFCIFRRRVDIPIQNSLSSDETVDANEGITETMQLTSVTELLGDSPNKRTALYDHLFMDSDSQEDE